MRLALSLIEAPFWIRLEMFDAPQDRSLRGNQNFVRRVEPILLGDRPISSTKLAQNKRCEEARRVAARKIVKQDELGFGCQYLGVDRSKDTLPRGVIPAHDERLLVSQPHAVAVALAGCRRGRQRRRVDKDDLVDTRSAECGQRLLGEGGPSWQLAADARAEDELRQNRAQVAR